MHPVNGYLLAQLNLSADDRLLAVNFLTKINQHLEAIGVGSLPLEDVDSALEKVSVGNLRTITELRPYMVEMSLVHPKVELSTEYIQIKLLIEKKVQEYLNKADSIVSKLDTDLKKEFKKALDEFSRKGVNLSYSMDKNSKEKHQNKIEQYLSFSEFKPLIDQVIGEKVALKTIFSYENDYAKTLAEMFNAMKNKIMAAKANIPSLVAQFGEVIPVEQIKDSDPVAYEYLRSKAFAELALEQFQLTIPLDKTYDQRIVRPQDTLAAKLKLTNVEMAIFAISVDPIRSFGLSKGQNLESSQNPYLKFKVSNDQLQMKLKQRIKVQVNDEEFVMVETPVYVSYVKAELVKSQQNSSIKQST